MDAKIENTLAEQGLDKNEISVYLTLLKTGSLKANDLARITKLPRTFVYEVLKALIEKGLASYAIKSGTKFFEAANPNKLKSILEEKQHKLQDIMPELENITKIVFEKPSVELYEGREGIKTLLEGILRGKPKSIMYAYANNKLFERLEFYFPNFVKRRIKNKIYAKIIQQKTFALLKARKNDSLELREMRFFPITFKTSVFIYGDMVTFITLEEDNFIGVKIKNKTIAETQKQVFAQLWRLAK